MRAPHTIIAGTFAANARRLVSAATMPSVLRSSIIGTDTTLMANTSTAKKPPHAEIGEQEFHMATATATCARKPRRSGTSYVKNSAKTTSDARAQTSRMTASTSANIPTDPTLGRHASSVGASHAGCPSSRRRERSYKPIARNGPSRKNPVTSADTY